MCDGKPRLNVDPSRLSQGVVSTLKRWVLARPQRQEVLICLGLLIAAIALFSIGLGGVPLRDWDEGTVAQVAKEMWQSEASWHGWVYPQLWGEPYLNKPPLLHGLIAITYGWGGVREVSARLPGASLSALSVLLLYGVGRELFSTRLPALWGALLYLTWLPVVRHGRLAMLDGAVVCFGLVALWGCLRLRRGQGWALVLGLGLGAVGLTKGIMALLFAGIIGLFLGWSDPQQYRRPMVWIGVALGVLPAIAWYWAQGQHYPDTFIQKGLLDQSWRRVFAIVEGNQGPPWYYGLELFKYAWPWLPFCLGGVVLAIRTLRQKTADATWAKLTLLWCGVYFGTISVMATKLPWYIYPLYPALALAGGAQLAQLWQTQSYGPWWRWWLALQTVGSIAGLTYALYQPVTPWLVGIAVVFTLTLTLAWRQLTRNDRRFLPILVGGTYLTLMVLMRSPLWVWEINENDPVQPIATLINQNIPPPSAGLHLICLQSSGP